METSLCTLAKDESHGKSKSQPCLAGKNASFASLKEKSCKLADCYIGFSEDESIMSDLSDDDDDDNDLSYVSHSAYAPVTVEQVLLESLGSSRWLPSDCSSDSRSRDAPKTPCRTTENV
jgi:hypothetical protein